MLITNKSYFIKGVTLLASFFVVLFLIFSPVFKDAKGKPQNGLEFSDDMFNRLAKGSAYFIPEVTKKVESVQGKMVDVTIKQKDAAAAEQAAKVMTQLGATAEAKDAAVHVTGDLGKFLGTVTQASDKVYKNDVKGASEMFEGADGAKSLKTAWGVLNPMIKELQKQKMIDEANVVGTVNGKAIEPAYNFLGIEGEDITAHIPLAAGLLIFYVIYTMWYGYGIFDVFNGIGLSMTKAKNKQEA